MFQVQQLKKNTNQRLVFMTGKSQEFQADGSEDRINLYPVPFDEHWI
jgi:hypothetical protein